MVDELSNGEFETFVKKGVCLVDFFAEWCMPCVMMAPVMEEISEKLKKIKFGKVNVDENQELAAKFKVMSIPTLIIFKDNKEIERLVGAQSEEVLEEKLKKYL